MTIRPTDLDTERLHAEFTRMVAEAVAAMLPKFAPRGLTIEAYLEGTAKGMAVATMTATGASLAEVGELFAEMADGMRADPPRDNDNNAPTWPPRAN